MTWLPTNGGAASVLMLTLCTSVAVGAEPAEINDALAEQPVETSLTAAALAQLELGGKERVPWALHQLESLLMLPGFRARAVDEALEARGAVRVLEETEATVKPKDQRALAASLRRQVVARLGWEAAAKAARITPGTPAAPTVHQVTSTRTWVSLTVPENREVALKLLDCSTAEARLFAPDGRRVGGVVQLDDFTPKVLSAPGGAGADRVRIDGDPSCDGWALAALERPGPRSVPSGTTAASPVKLGNEGVFRVTPESGETLFATFDAEPGSIYRVRTSDLVGNTDTRISLTPPGAEAPIVDDDGGGGLSSYVRFDTLLGGPTTVRVDLLRSNRDTGYRLKIEQEFRYDVDAPVTLSAEPTSLPPAAWNGFVLPVTLSEGVGRVQFNAVRGNVYRVHSGLNVELLGPEGGDGFRLLVGEEPRPWSVRRYHVFVAMENGPTQLIFSEPEGEHTGPWFTQVINEPELEPVPHVAKFGTSASRPTALVPTTEETWDGGVLGEIAAGGEAWVRFKTRSNTSYRVSAEATDPDAKLTLALMDARNLRHVVAGVDRPGAIVTARPAGEGVSAFVALVRNVGDEAVKVRLAAHSDVAYDGFRLGDLVRVTQHRSVGGETNWSDRMAPFLGRNGRIVEFAGQDSSGSWVIRLDVDKGAWAWRTRDLTLAERAAN
jgi:hypothetical protein